MPGGFGTLRPQGAVLVVRSDNGLIFQSRRFRAACSFYGLPQEFITPYTPEQNGMIERFFRSLKEECVWQQQFANFAEAQRAIRRWIRWYNEERPHQALGYRSPCQGAPPATAHGCPSETVQTPTKTRGVVFGQRDYDVHTGGNTHGCHDGEPDLRTPSGK